MKLSLLPHLRRLVLIIINCLLLLAGSALLIAHIAILRTGELPFKQPPVDEVRHQTLQNSDIGRLRAAILSYDQEIRELRSILEESLDWGLVSAALMTAGAVMHLVLLPWQRIAPAHEVETTP